MNTFSGADKCDLKFDCKRNRPDDGVWTCSVGNLTRISWETSLALVCGQLFAPPPVKSALWMHEYSDVIKFSKNGGFHRTLK